MLNREKVNIRDPYILLHEGIYYLYGTRSATCWGEQMDLTVIKVKIWKIGKDRLKFFTDRKAFSRIGIIGRRSAIL